MRPGADAGAVGYDDGDPTPSRALRDDQAGTLHVRQGGISRAQATDIAVVQGGIGIARGQRVSVQMGGIGLAVTSDARVSRAFVRSILARDVSVEQAAVGTMAANHVTFERPGLVGLILARRVDGEVKALLDWRGALAVGAGLAVLRLVLRRR